MKTLKHWITLLLLVVLLFVAVSALPSASVWAAPADAPSLQQGGGGGGNAGIFTSALEKIRSLARDAWSFLASLILIVAVLGALYYALQGTAGAAFGGSRMASAAIVGVVGLIILALVVFLVLPSLSKVLTDNVPQAPF